MTMYRNTGLKPKAKARNNFGNINTFRQYTLMPDHDKDLMYAQWCTKHKQDPEAAGVADMFFDTIDSIQDDSELDNLIDLDKPDENNLDENNPDQ